MTFKAPTRASLIRKALKANERVTSAGTLQVCQMITFGSVNTANERHEARRNAVLWVKQRANAKLLTHPNTGHITGAIDCNWQDADKRTQNLFERRIVGLERVALKEHLDRVEHCRRWAKKLGYVLVALDTPDAKPLQPKPALYVSGGGLTWSGRGKKPMWLQAVLDGGTKLSEYVNAQHPDAAKVRARLEKAGR